MTAFDKKVLATGAFLTIPVLPMCSASAGAAEQDAVAVASLTPGQQQALEKALEIGADKLLWSDFLTVADELFLADSKQINLEQQESVSRLKFDFGEKLKVSPSDDGTKVHVTTFALKGSFPVTGENDKNRLPSLNGLANGSTLELQFAFTSRPLPKDLFSADRFKNWGTSVEPTIRQSLQIGTAPAACWDLVSRRHWQKANPDSDNVPVLSARLTALRADLAQAFATAPEDDLNAQRAIANADRRLDDAIAANGAVVEACVSDERIQALWNLAEPEDVTSTWGVSATIGQEDFSYTDLTTFQVSEGQKTTYAFSAFWRGQWGDEFGGRSISAGLDFQSAFKENDMSTECMDPDDISTCIEAVFGPPMRSEDFIAKVGYAQVLSGFRIVGDKDAAFRINANYDIDNDVFGVDVPLFLYRGKDSLGAGIRGGWRSDTDNFEVGFFVSQKFSL